MDKISHFFSLLLVLKKIMRFAKVTEMDTQDGTKLNKRHAIQARFRYRSMYIYIYMYIIVFIFSFIQKVFIFFIYIYFIFLAVSVLSDFAGFSHFFLQNILFLFNLVCLDFVLDLSLMCRQRQAADRGCSIEGVVLRV